MNEEALRKAIKKQLNGIEEAQFYAATSHRDTYSGSNEMKADLAQLELLRERLKLQLIPKIAQHIEGKSTTEVVMWILSMIQKPEGVKF